MWVDLFFAPRPNQGRYASSMINKGMINIATILVDTDNIAVCITPPKNGLPRTRNTKRSVVSSAVVKSTEDGTARLLKITYDATIVANSISMHNIGWERKV